MPLTATIAPVSPTKARFSLKDSTGALISDYFFNPQTKKGQEQVQAELGPLKVLDCLNETYSGLSPTAKNFSIPDKAPDAHLWRVRGFHDQNVQWTATTDLTHTIRSALDDTRDVVIEWKGKDALCCLDIDYHSSDVPAPSEEFLTNAVLTSLTPAPLFWHFTRRGGIHAFYEGGNGLTAEERAALGLLSWHLLDPTATVDLPTQVRPVPVGKSLRLPAGDPSGDVVGSWLSGGATGADSDEVAALLESRGWAIGGRYPHGVCPLDPTPGDSKNDPVEVTERGVFCFRCQSKGLVYGRSRQPGFASWTALLGRVECGAIRNCVKNLTHWGHARWVLSARTQLPHHILPTCYRGALKVFHRGSEKLKLIPMVFNKDTDWLVRGDGCWQTVEQGYQWPKEIGPILSCLPACNTWNEEKDVPVAIKSTVNVLQQPTLDLTERGYQPIEVMKGFKLHNDTTEGGRITVTTPAEWLKGYGPEFHPKYLPLSKRMAEDAAKAVLDAKLPGINWQYVYALILARGAREIKVGLHPHLVVDGKSGAGKSTQVKIAASILGDQVGEVPYDSNTEKFRSAIRDSSKEGSFIVIDEFLKDTLRGNSKVSPEQVLDPILNLNEGSKSHKMYLGPTALGHIGVCVWTETQLPPFLKDYTQIARRVHYLHLPEPVRWEGPMAAMGLDRAEKLRCVSLEVATACNSILSWIVDKYFGFRLSFSQMAEEIGVKTLQQCDDFQDLTELCREFFKAVCDASDPDESDRKRFPGRGYKVFRRNDAINPDLCNLWAVLADGEGDKWPTSKRLMEKSFKEILRAQETVHLDISSTSSVVAVRFRQGPLKTPVRVNGEVI